MKLFRKVRQKLSNEGEFRRYLVYAIGEILLVMIGILLALQVNNWNRNRISHSKETKALKSLQKEFELNESRILKKQNSRISIMPDLNKYISKISNGDADYSTYKEFHSKEFMFGMTNPSNGVINALISSGEISIISNDSLKYYLADWKNQMENLYENEQILWDAGIGFLSTSANRIPNPKVNWSDWDLGKLKIASEGIISDIGYRNNLVGFEGCSKIVIDECNTTLAALDKILVILTREIDSLQ